MVSIVLLSWNYHPSRKEGFASKPTQNDGKNMNAG
jgi:hypothetical protein